MSAELPRTVKVVTVWLLLGLAVFLGIQWRQHSEAQTRFQLSGDVIEIRRGSDGHYHWPGTVNGRAVDFLVDTGATGTAISAALARELGLESSGSVRSSTAGGVVTGQVVRADVALQGGVHRRALAAGRLARARRPAVAGHGTCSAACNGNSATACCASICGPGR